MTLFEELKRRNVLRVTIAYTVLAWLVAQVGDLLLEAFGAPDWVLKTLLAVMLLGFPFVVFFAWAFELTPEGLKREAEVVREESITSQTGHKLNRAITLLLVLAVAYFAWDKYLSGPAAPESVTVAEVSSEQAAQAEPAAEPEPESTLPDDLSIAVLPFENRSLRQEDEFFADGIHDDLLTQLAQIGALRVISRTSVAQFKGTRLSIREIAELLNVATVLEGGVQRAGNQVRINMQLIDADTDGHLWAQTFDREMTANNIFTIQSEIAQAVTKAMRATLTPEEASRIAAVPTESMEALEQYFKGRAELDQRTLPSIESARMRLENARTIDPGFALAWAGEALAILLLIDSGSSYGSIPLEEALALAAPLIERAFELAPEDPQVLGVYGLYENNSESFERAEDFYQKSLAINPSSGEVMNWRRMNLGPLDRLHEANELAVKMVEADPMSMIGVYNALLTIHRQPGYDSAQVGQLLDRLERLDKSYGLAARSEVARRDGNHVEAVRYGLASLEADPGRTPNRRALASSLLNLGFRLEALKLNPQLDEEQLALAAGDFETVLRLTRERHAADPESRPDRNELIEATLRARGDPEEVMPIARQIWQEYQDGDEDYQCTFCWPILRPMAWAAQAGEYPEEARQWRTELARRIQETLDSGLVNAGLENAFRYMMDMLDGRHKEAIERLEHGFENNGWRTPYLLADAEFDPLHPYLEFQTLVARMNETLDEERRAVVAMLCGPDSILVSWEPAPETCAGYPPKNAGSE